MGNTKMSHDLKHVSDMIDKQEAEDEKLEKDFWAGQNEVEA